MSNMRRDSCLRGYLMGKLNFIKMIKFSLINIEKDFFLKLKL